MPLSIPASSAARKYHFGRVLAAFFLLLVVVGCVQRKPEQVTKRESPVTGELTAICAQLDKMAIDTLLSPEIRLKRNLEFRRTVYQFLAQSLLVEAADQLRGATILYQTASLQETESLLLAHLLALEASRKGAEEAQYHAAACLDRYLVRKGLAQKYGTQQDRDRFGRWYIPYFDTLTSDSERAAWGVPHLDSLNALVAAKNR